jgi:hypothetical protein
VTPTLAAEAASNATQRATHSHLLCRVSSVDRILYNIQISYKFLFVTELLSERECDSLTTLWLHGRRRKEIHIFN